MSNSIAPGSSADVNVKVTALTTNPNVPVTYKTVILKKNLVNGVNTLTQEMMSITNTKYVIKYDYVLGEDITIPANCILEFDGGSLKNSTGNTYKVTGSKTKINTDVAYNIFDNTLGGGFELPYLDLRWVGGVSDYNNGTGTDNAFAFERAFNILLNYYNGLNILLVGQYYISTTVETECDINIKGTDNSTFDFYSIGQSTPPSPSMIVIAANTTAFKMVGRSKNTSTIAAFSFHNIRVQGMDESSSIFLEYTASGGPGRNHIVEECMFLWLNKAFFFNGVDKDTMAGQVTISKCLAYGNYHFLWAENIGYNRTLCNLIVKDSNISASRADYTFYIKNAYSALIFDNNVLESNPKCFYISQRMGTLAITNNYFEDMSNGIFLEAQSNSYKNKLIFNGNDFDDGGKVTVKVVEYTVQGGEYYYLNDDSSFAGCIILDNINMFKTKWIREICQFPILNIGVPDNLKGNIDTIAMGVMGKTLNNAAWLYISGVNAENINDYKYCAFYSCKKGSVNIGLIQGGSGSTFIRNIEKGMLCIAGFKPYAVGSNTWYIMSGSSNTIILGGVQTVEPDDNTPGDILIPNTQVILNKATNEITATLPKGYQVFDTTNRLLFWNGTAWVDATGATV